ncbi:MAG: HEAT repeat domain-containing protein [Planctomycetaceae bacterium]
MPPAPRRMLHACAAAIVCGWLAGCSGLKPLHQREHALTCRQCAAGAPCPARPGHFGYYKTQWRHWPDAGEVAVSTTGTATPVAPPRSVVPNADEESPLQPTAPPDETAPPADALGAASRRIATISAEATAAAAASPARQAEFTQRLADQLLAEHDPLVRSRIVEAAAAFDTLSAAAICAGAVADPDPRVRAAACDAWATRGGPDAVRLLTARFDGDAELTVRLRALRALGSIRDESAIAVLARALDDPDPAIQMRAMRSLRQLAGRDLGGDPAAWRAWAANPRRTSFPWSLSRELLPAFLR